MGDPNADVHIYNLISGALSFWGTTKALGILLEIYPNPKTAIEVCHSTRPPIPTAEQIMSEFLTLFYGKIRLMTVEKFHISFTGDAQPF